MKERIVILVTDDEEATLTLIHRKLSAHLPSAELIFARSGRECLDLLQYSSPDLLLLDYIMPDSNGLEVLKELKGKGREIPVIFMTAYGNEEVAAEALRLGAQAYLHKGDLFHVLEAIVDKVLEQHHLLLQNQTIVENFNGLIQSRTQDLQAQNHLLNVIHSHHDIRKAFDELYHEMRALVPVDWLAMGLVTPEGSAYRLYAVAPDAGEARRPFGLAGTELELTTADSAGGDGAISWALRHVQNLIVNSTVVTEELASESCFPSTDRMLHEEGIRSYAVFPFEDCSGKSFGSFNVASREADFFTDERIQLLSAITFHISLSLINQRKASLEGLNQSVTTMQHVVNNALAAIVGNAQLLLLKNSTDLPERVNTIVDSSMRISGCLNQLLKITDPLLQTATLGGIKFLDVNSYLTGNP